MSDVIWVDELTAADGLRAGPKMAKLGELRRAGVPVPGGYVVTADAYQAVWDATSIGAEVDAVLADVAHSDTETAARLAAEARRLVCGLELPERLLDAVGTAYERLSQQRGIDAVPVAVRSSGTGEDAADASFAGQFDSYLGVTGVDAVAAAMQACWASLFTDRAVIYRAAKAISYADCPMAVGVLELVDARSSGVAFSVHPVTGRSDRIVIEGSWGLGETIVQGRVTPDRVEVGKSDGRVLDYLVGAKALMSRFDQQRQAVLEVDVPDALRDQRALTDEEVEVIAKAVHTIERHFGHAVDVEWVTSRSADGEPAVTIVQARPETVHGPSGSSVAPEWNATGYAMKYAFGKDG